jgi:hypothetical protein
LNFGLPTPFFTHSIRGTLGRSGIDITISFSSDWKSALKGVVDYIRAGLKVMVYCQSAALATDKVKPFCQVFLSDLGCHDRDAVSLTGSDGIMMKAFLVDIFSGKLTSDVCDLAMIAGTSAMNCGISSNFLHYILHVGFPRRPSEMIQTLGRLCRGPLPRARQDSIRYILSLSFFLPIFMVASSNKDANERYRQVYELKQVVRLLVLPTECYHVSFERYYSDYADGSIALGRPCLRFCPYCRGEHLNFVSSLRRDVLVDYLDSSVFIDGPCTIGSLAKSLYNKRGSIWIATSKKVTTGHIHALIMQLWTTDILDIRLSAEALKILKIL